MRYPETHRADASAETVSSEKALPTTQPTVASPNRAPLVGWLAFAALLAMAVGAHGQGTETPKLRFEPHTFETHDGQSVEAELGRLTVKENRLAADSRDIELAFVRFRSTRPPSEGVGSPIVYLAGGPGGSGIETARYDRFPLFMALRRFGDVIAFDQRGTGQSGGAAMRCHETYELPLDLPGDPVISSVPMQTAAKACAARLTAEGFDLAGYTTGQSAADLEDLRRALGAPKITLWGISYGTHLALAALKDHGEHIDRVILAGLEGLDQTLKLPVDQEHLLAEIARRARRDKAVHAVLPDLLASIQQISDRLRKESVTVPFIHPISGDGVTVSLGVFDFQQAMAGMLRGPETFRFMPDMLARMETGDFVSLAASAVMGNTGTPGSMMSLVMDCVSGASPERRALIAQQAKTSLLADAINFPLPSICQAVPVAPADSDFRRSPRSTVPALLISGTLDGRTPPHNANDLLPGLSKAHHLVVDGAGHSDPLFLSSPRILETMERFLAGQPLALERLEVEVPSFVPPRRLATLTTDQWQRFAGTYRSPEGQEFQLLPAGGIAYLMAGRRPQILRAMSPTELFFEGAHRHLELILDADDAVAGIRLIDGDGGEPLIAHKV